MLVLTRRESESLLIGDDIKLTVLKIENKQITVDVNSEIFYLKIEEGIEIGDDIKVTVVKIIKGQVKLGFDAPKDVTINREERETTKP